MRRRLLHLAARTGLAAVVPVRRQLIRLEAQLVRLREAMAPYGSRPLR